MYYACFMNQFPPLFWNIFRVIFWVMCRLNWARILLLWDVVLSYCLRLFFHGFAYIEGPRFKVALFWLTPDGCVMSKQRHCDQWAHLITLLLYVWVFFTLMLTEKLIGIVMPSSEILKQLWLFNWIQFTAKYCNSLSIHYWFTRYFLISFIF